MMIARRIFVVISIVFCLSSARDFESYDDDDTLVLSHVVSCSFISFNILYHLNFGSEIKILL